MFLSGRLQKVILDNNQTEFNWITLYYGVPKGTILGPFYSTYT